MVKKDAEELITLISRITWNMSSARLEFFPPKNLINVTISIPLVQITAARSPPRYTY